MAEKYAVRNLRFCTKDCLCLYVCPTGATDTENSIIDANKCIGCGKCAEACPSSAISMMPKTLPPQQPKEEAVVEALRVLIQSKAAAEGIASQLPDALSVAVERSSRLMAEDLCREAGFMLPQSANTRAFLETVRNYPGVPVDAVETLLTTIQFNEKTEAKKMEKWKCSICGYVHEGAMTPDFKCPLCKQSADKFVKVEQAPAKNPFAGSKTEKNLWDAFAGESQARNKYTYFASVAKKAGYEQIAALFLQTAENGRSMQNSGLRRWVSWAILQKTCCTLQRVKTTSGQTCMTVWPVMRTRRASMSWLSSSVVLPLSRRPMRSAIGNYCTMWRQRPSLKRAALPCGSAVTAVIWSWV